jgi:hypothetical protein
MASKGMDAVERMDAVVMGEYKVINFQIYNFARAKISIRENSIL